MICRARTGIFLAALLALAAILPAAAIAAGKCPAGYHQTGEQDEHRGNTTIKHAVCAPDDDDSPAPAPPEPQAVSCARAQEQADLDRAAVEQIQQTAEENQSELSEWTRMNTDAQKGALWAGVEFAMSSYAADTERMASSASKLESRAEFLARKLTTSRKQKIRLQYLTELQGVTSSLPSAKRVLLAKKTVLLASNIDQAWGVARGTMQNEFRVAAKHDASLQQLLKDPGFRDAFAGDSPTTEVLSSLADQALDDAVKAASSIEQYEKFTGPTVRAGVFVREEAYNALKSLLSTNRVLQANDVAGELAKASGVLEGRYKKSVDALRSCQSDAR
jgi:hypothetical protein